MPNPEIIVKPEGKLIWHNQSKTGAKPKILELNKGGLRAQVTKHLVTILKDDGSLDHWKKTQEPEIAVTLSMLYRDRLGSLLGATPMGFEDKDAGVSTAFGNIYHQGNSGGIIDVLGYPNVTLMGYTIASAADGNMIDLSFQGIGEPTNAAAAVADQEALTLGNVEAMVAAETYVRWKSGGAGAPVAKTLGFTNAGWRLSVQYQKVLVRKTDTTFSHAKVIGVPTWDLTVNQFYQDGTTNLLFDAVSGYGNKAAGKTVPFGTIAVEGLLAAGSGALESIQLANAVLTNWDFSQANEGNPLALTFRGVGAPDFLAATLA
ncbi:hypothetical protein D3C86_768210 [compost metagenome]